MPRVGLTGGLGSGKSTVAAMFAAHGAYVLSADELARGLMQPGQPVFREIVQHFGPTIQRPDGTLDRNALARLAFADGRAEELNTIVHPVTIALQQQRTEEILQQHPDAVVLVESALVFETRFGEGWRERFDFMILVTAAEATKIARFCARAGGRPEEGLEAEARRRLAHMIPDEEKAGQCDFILPNDGSLDQLRTRVDRIWQQLTRTA